MLGARRTKRALARVLWVMLGLLLASLAAQRAHAEPEVSGCAEQLDDADVSARLRWLDARLSRGVGGATAWWAGWFSYASAEGAVGFTEFARMHDRLERDLWLVTGVGAGLWVVQLTLFPMSAAYAPLRTRALPRATAAQRRAALVVSERVLGDAARAERDARHWSEHALDLAWALGAASYAFGRSVGRASNRRVLGETGLELGTTVLLSEAAILSTPQQAIRDQERYRAWSCHEPAARGRAWPTRVAPVWHVRLEPMGVALRVRF